MRKDIVDILSRIQGCKLVQYINAVLTRPVDEEKNCKIHLFRQRTLMKKFNRHQLCHLTARGVCCVDVMCKFITRA